MDPAMVKNLALGAIPPFVLALVYFVAMWGRERPAERAGQDWRLVATPLVMAGGLLLTYWITFQAPGMPRAAFDWLPVVAVAGGVAGAIAALGRLPVLLRWLPALGAVLFGAWASARNLIAGSWTWQQAATLLVEAGVVGVVVLAAAHVLDSRTRGRVPAPLLALTLFAGAASQLLVLGLFSMKVGQVAGMSASMLLAACAVSAWRPGFRLGAGGAAFVLVMTLTCFTQGRLFGQGTPMMGRVYGVLLVLSLVGAALASLALRERWSARRRALAVVGVAAAPLLVGLGIAGKLWMDAEKAAEEDPYADYVP